MPEAPRVTAAVAELNTLIQSLIQRNINLAGDLAVAQQQNAAQAQEIERLNAQLKSPSNEPEQIS